MQASLFARFLHRIGKDNAATLTTLRFRFGELDGDPVCKDGSTIGKAMNVVTQLLQIHVSGVRDLRIVLRVYVREPYSSWFGSGEESKSDGEPKSPGHHTWRPYPTVELVRLDISKEAVQKLSGLNYLEFTGFESDAYVRRELEKLELAIGCRKDQVKSCNLTTDILAQGSFKDCMGHNTDEEIKF